MTHRLAAGEEEQERMKHDMNKGARALHGAAKPFVHHSTKKCQMHVKVRRWGRGRLAGPTH